MQFTHRFLLHCDPLHSEFTLSMQGETCQTTFDSFDDAYAHAEARATYEMPLSLLNCYGAVIFETTISPLEPELLRARAHWRELTGLRKAEEENLQKAWLADVVV